MSKERLLYIDVARVIAMLWIVGWWHLIQYCKGGEEPYRFLGDNSITMLMLGLFMFLSGFLIGKKSFKTKSDVKLFYKSRFWRFYLLFALSVITFPITGFNGNFRVIITTLTATSPYILPQPITLWFMSMLTGFYILTPFVKRSMLIGGGILLIFILLHIIIPGGIDTRVFVYYPLYALGLYISETTVLDRVTQNKLIILLSLILSLLLYFGAIYYEWLVYPFILIGIILILSVCRFLKNERIKTIISFVSYSSLCAYLFHRQIYTVVSGVLRKLGHSELAFVLLIGLPICIILSWVIQKVYDRILKKLKII